MGYIKIGASKITKLNKHKITPEDKKNVLNKRYSALFNKEIRYNKWLIETGLKQFIK